MGEGSTEYPLSHRKTDVYHLLNQKKREKQWQQIIKKIKIK